MKSRTLWRVFAGAITLVAALALVRTFAQERKKERSREPKAEAQEKATAPRVTVVNGKTVVRLSAEEQSQAGIATTTLKAVRQRKQMEVPAMVLDVQGLVTLASGYATAQANLRKAQNNLSVSQAEYNRLKSLHASQNVSVKDFQAAEGAFENDQASVAAARQDVAYDMAALRQNWGNKIAQWIAADPPALNRILNREDVLVEVTLPESGAAAAPGEVSLEVANQRRATAKLVSRFPHVDPRIQGPSFLYVARQQGALAPGLNLIVRFAVGPLQSGFVAPISAVVWWQGDPWVYVEAPSGSFTRKVVQGGHPVAGGFFCTAGFLPGEKIVVRGAEDLLAIELNPTPPNGGGKEGDED